MLNSSKVLVLVNSSSKINKSSEIIQMREFTRTSLMSKVLLNYSSDAQ